MCIKIQEKNRHRHVFCVFSFFPIIQNSIGKFRGVGLRSECQRLLKQFFPEVENYVWRVRNVCRLYSSPSSSGFQIRNSITLTHNSTVKHWGTFQSLSSSLSQIASSKRVFQSTSFTSPSSSALSVSFFSAKKHPDLVAL